MTTPPTFSPGTPVPPSQPPKPGFSTAAMVVIAFGGFLVTLILGGAALGVYLYTQRSASNGAGGTGGTEGKSADPGGDSGSSSGSTNSKGEAGPSQPQPSGDTSPIPADPGLKPSEGDAPEAKPVDPNLASVLGREGEIDRLDVPVALPKGMVAFISGLDKLAAYKPLDAIPFLTQAIETNEENSDYFTARGSAYVVAERMEQGLPDLQRALRLNPKNLLASRMTRLAYLMMGDQMSASKFYGHGGSSNIDFLITEVGVGYGNRALAKQGGYKIGMRDEQKAAAAVQKLPVVSQMVAGAYRSNDGQSVQALFALGVEQLRAGDYAAARSGFQDVLAKYPQDWTSRYYYARALMGTGDPELARRELTFLLCWKRFLPEAYAARAICAARQNDGPRARADLEIARKLDPAKAAEAEPEVAKVRAQAAPAGAEKDAQAYDDLLQAVKARPSFEDLVARCSHLRQSVDARRLRWDERYQMGLYERCAAARAKRGDAERLCDVADYLWENREVRGVQIVLNGATTWFRRQTPDSATMEIQFVKALAEEGLNFNPRSGRCYAIKADVLLIKENNLEAATQAAGRAVQLAPRLPQAYMSLSNCCKESATRLRERAAALRAPKTGSRRVVDQHGNYLRDETYLIPASAEDLAQAEACDREAAVFKEKEQKCFDAALASAKGTREEPYYQALIYYLRKDYANAKTWMEKAVAENPGNDKFPFALANCIQALGDPDGYLEAFGRAVNRQETTAAVWLRVAWEKIERNAWDAARKALLRARELDPADARIPAYTGVIAEFGARDAAEAEACFRIALALEEARARANNTTFLAGPTTPLSPEDAGLTLMLRLKAARYAFQRDPAMAAEYYTATAAMEPRLSAWKLAEPVKAGMLPDPERDARQNTMAMPLVSILKNNRIFAAQALINAGKNAEAGPHIAEAENFINRLPAGGEAYLDFELEPQYVPFVVSSMSEYVRLLNAQMLLQQGKKDAAVALLYKVRYYLANQTQRQRATKDDPIPPLYQQLARQAGIRN
ncbi:MAG: tetratricopeptide repeat protein [Planctomycetota bacterium]|nr:tetratricopeptide repeat protein [Planctomycetota bacterium]